MDLNKDLITKIALELSPPDLINFCLSAKENNVCSSQNKTFWRLKLQKDYPEVFNYYFRNNLVLVNPKKTYIRKFTEIIREIENFVTYNYPYLTLDSEKELSKIIYKIYEEIEPIYLQFEPPVEINKMKEIFERLVKDKYKFIKGNDRNTMENNYNDFFRDVQRLMKTLVDKNLIYRK